MLGRPGTVQGGGLSRKKAVSPDARRTQARFLRYSFPSPSSPSLPALENRMTALRYLRDTALASLLLTACGGLVAQAQTPPTTTFEPTVGQAGKDVVWVPTPQALVDKMLE